MEVNKEKVTALSLTIVTGGMANIFLLLSLLLTWKYWRQVKWYIVALAAANWVELAFRYGTDLAWHLTVSWEGGSQWSCKLLMMLHLLGTTLASMAVGALGLHTLLTVITGSQGDRCRHLFVLGLFLLLALPLPLVQIPKYRLLPIPFLQDGSQQCVSFYFFNSAEEEYYYLVGCVTALVYFPLSVVIVCGVVSGFLLKGRQGNVRGEEHVSDLLITGILGTLLFICCAPYYTHLLGIRRAGHSSYEEELVSSKLAYLEHCRNIFSALFTAAFAYLYVYRKRSETHLAPTTCGTAIGERQQLVN